MSILNPLDYPICFEMPLRVTATTWMQHVPFGMFMIDVLRPKIVVELGSYAGVSYCAFCQAVKELQTNSRCYAVDTWQGDPQSGFYGSETLEDLRVHHDPLYGSFSRLVQSTFEEALVNFEDKSIDLLHIDGLHTYEAVKQDFEGWLPKMTDQGVILFHDTNVRERDFGVWKFWGELKLKYPCFEFLHGHGLGVLSVGQQRPQILQKLFESSENERTHIREFFYQLGVRIEVAQQLKQLTEEQRNLIGKLNHNEQQLQQLEQMRTVRFLRVLADQGVVGVVQKGTAKVQRKLTSNDSTDEQ